MKKPHAPAVRVYLRNHPEGATTNEMMLHVESLRNTSNNVLRNVLGTMPDAYIDRWAEPVRGQFQAVWCVVIAPPHCPYPTDRFEHHTQWVDKHKAYAKGFTYAHGRMLK